MAILNSCRRNYWRGKLFKGGNYSKKYSMIRAHLIYIPLQPIKDEADSQRKAESQEIQQKQQQIFQEQQLMKQQQGQQIIQQQQIR